MNYCGAMDRELDPQPQGMLAGSPAIIISQLNLFHMVVMRIKTEIASVCSWEVGQDQNK